MFFTLVKGEGRSKVSALNAFDRALLDAGIGNTNLIKLSSILPPHYIQRDSYNFRKKVAPGSKLPIAYSYRYFPVPEDSTQGLNCNYVSVGAGVGVGIPRDRSQPGVIMEYSTIVFDYTQQASFNLITNIKHQLIAMVQEAMDIREQKDYYVETIVQTSPKPEPEEGYVCVFAGVALAPLWDDCIG